MHLIFITIINDRAKRENQKNRRRVLRKIPKIKTM